MEIVHYVTTTFWDQYGDPRVRHYPMMSSMKPLLVVMASYALFVKLIGPLYMQNRKPYSLKWVIFTYNIFLTVANILFFFRFIFWGMDIFDLKFKGFNNTTEIEMNKIFYSNLYLLSKLVDLLDTIFFVLRKKQSQITGLHFYHHFSVPFFGWIIHRLCGSSNPALIFALLNTFVHTLMYFYYAMSALGPKWKPYLWWKPYITQLQISQFVVLAIYGAVFIQFQQGYPKIISAMYATQPITFLVLFSRFYIRSYIKKKDLKNK